MEEWEIIEDSDYGFKNNTSNIIKCNNKGCGFNKDSKCSATGTTCFGYIELKDEK